jgi:hypothetical protein
MGAGKRICAVVAPAALVLFSAPGVSAEQLEGSSHTDVIVSAFVRPGAEPALPEAVLVIKNESSLGIKVQDPDHRGADSRIVVHWRLPSGEKFTDERPKGCPVGWPAYDDDDGPETFSVSPGRSVKFTISLVNYTCPGDGPYRKPLSPGRYTVVLEYHWAKRRVWWSPPLSFRVPAPRERP